MLFSIVQHMVYRTVVRVPLLADQPLFTATRLSVKYRNLKMLKILNELIKHKSHIVCWQHYITLPCCQRVFVILVCLLDTKYMRYTEIAKFHLVTLQRN